MKNATAVGVFNSMRHFCHELHALSRCIAQRSRVLLQASLLRELHAEKRQAIVAFAHLINRKDVWVIQTSHCLCFSSETLQRFGRISAITKDALYGHDAPGMSLPGAIDHTHTAATDLFEDFVISEVPRPMWCIYLGEDFLIERLR